MKSSKHNKHKNRASEIDDPQAQVRDFLNNFPDIASDLKHLLHLIDSGKAVDITGISHKSLINPLKNLFLSLNLNQLSHDGAFVLPHNSPPTLHLVGSVFSTRSKPPVVVVGPERPSAKLLAAAAKLQEAEAALKEAEQEQEQELKEDNNVVTSLIGPTQPERFEEVTRIMLVSDEDINLNYPYDVLGVQQQRRMLSDDELKKKYLKLSLLVHPDKCSHPRANEAFVKVNEAFRELSDPVRRRAVNDRIEDKEMEEERLRAMEGRGESERARKAKRDYLRARNVLASLASDEERKKEKRKRGKEKEEEEEEEWVGKHPWRPWDREKDLEGGRPSVKLDSEDLYEGVWSQF